MTPGTDGGRDALGYTAAGHDTIRERATATEPRYSMMSKLFPHAICRRARLCLGAGLLAAAGCATVGQAPAPSSNAAAPAAASTPAATSAPADKPKQCYNGCQQWGETCNVDPRGVYRCQRRCAKFGEICE